ncbi:hypothetical protein [Xanthobacter autotrophicus]|uniref:hypothetical protein n=1 Tax=Xanthobacter autotrophicus TaxID=280 RepID=UPI00372B81FF
MATAVMTPMRRAPDLATSGEATSGEAEPGGSTVDAAAGDEALDDEPEIPALKAARAREPGKETGEWDTWVWDMGNWDMGNLKGRKSEPGALKAPGVTRYEWQV